EFDRHLRVARRLYRARRAALVAALATELPEARAMGAPGGVHAPVRLAEPFDAEALVAAAAARDVGISPLTWFTAERTAVTDTLVLGYGDLTEPAIAEGVRRLAAALGEVRG
ncbi:MAG TPA: PLP-dependent aminotransferase family protein, partial [Capillimicrobium sp.]